MCIFADLNEYVKSISEMLPYFTVSLYKILTDTYINDCLNEVVMQVKLHDEILCRCMIF